MRVRTLYPVDRCFHPPGGVSDRSIEKIFSGKNQAGSITKDAVGFTVKIKAGMLTVDKEPQIRALIAQLFTAGSNDGGQPLAISIDLATSIFDRLLLRGKEDLSQL